MFEKVTHEFETPVVITGKGDSLWGTSNGRYLIEKIVLNYLSDSMNHAELQVFGDNTDWFQYTDSQIEAEVNKKLLKAAHSLLVKNTHVPMHKVPKFELSWSEQGMQPADGWSFDFGIPLSKR